MYELRYRGELLGFHASRDAAESHARTHHGFGRSKNTPRTDTQVEDPENLTIEPRRPFTLFCRGALVDTFHSQSDAEAFVEAEVKKAAARPRRPIPEDFARAAYEIVEGTEPAPQPEPVTA